MPLLEQVQEVYERFMRGRRGADYLALCCLGSAFVIGLIGIFSGWIIFTLICAALYGWTLWRMLSTDIPARAREEKQFRIQAMRTKKWFMNLTGQKNDSASYKYFKCPSCAKPMRMPLGLGIRRVICPQCKCTFRQKS